MGRHDQQKGAVLSPGVVERATMSHFKTLFPDPSPVTGQNMNEKDQTEFLSRPQMSNRAHEW